MVILPVKGGADALDMDTLGFFLYMDEIENQQKEEQESIFGNDDEDGEEE